MPNMGNQLVLLAPNMFKVNFKSYRVQPMESLIKIGLNIKQSGDELCQALAVLDVFTQHLMDFNQKCQRTRLMTTKCPHFPMLC